MSMASHAPSAGDGACKVLSGLCPDSKCQAKLFFPAQDSSVECTGCGQRHSTRTLKDVAAVTNPDVAVHNMLLNILLGNTKPKKGADSVKVLGLSNYFCKILSPLLTYYGMDRRTKKAMSLKEMEQGEMFDCSILGDRAFVIDPEHIDTVGYGRDRTGSMKYLSDTLTAIKHVNNDNECLIPIHADGDGHCLVHAVSRCLVGRELFWHALRENLKKQFRENIDQYKAQFHDFIASHEWEVIIDECDPYYIPPNGEPLGLRNIHIFGLANVLQRPVILLDSMSGLQSSGDYSGVFLPGLVAPVKCRGRDGVLNKPICLAWSSSGRNHYVALVAIKGRPLPVLPNWMISRAWGMTDEAIADYIDLDDNGCCTIGGSKCLSDQYIHNLALAMEEKFMETYQINPTLVVDVHQYVYKSTGVVSTRPEDVIRETQHAVCKRLLYRCLTCEAISLLRVESDWLIPGGMLYQLAIQTHGQLLSNKKYSFPLHGITCHYDPLTNQLVPEMDSCNLSHCGWCQGSRMRQVKADGGINYVNGDKTTTRTTSTRCQCGFKHFWDGKEYDNLPEVFPLSLEWDGQVIQENVAWFYGESDPALNSNVYDIAHNLVQKHFPGEFGSELLVQKVVNTIIRQTAKKEKHQSTTSLPMAGLPADGEVSDQASVDSSWRQDRASKIILTGPKHKTVHKEELTVSKTEKNIQKNITQHAASQQKRKTEELQRSAEKAKSTVTRPKSAPVTGATKKPQTMASSARKVKVTTSGGKQTMFTLEMDTTFGMLQTRIADELGVPVSQQKIRYGFPLKELVPPSDSTTSEPLPLQHGDRVVVEVLSDQKQPHGSNSVVHEPEHVWPAQKPKQGWTNFQGDIHDHSAEGLLQGLNQMHNTGDSLDMSIASLSLMATLTGRDLWSYVQTMPHLFSVGGLFYQQVKRDLGLSDGKHCTLPCLPGKVFRYNGNEDRLELCLEPTGHFPIEPGVEQKAEGEGSLASVGQVLATGASGIVVNKPMNTQFAFSGQGHTLSGNKENIKMPQDLEPTSHNNRAKSFNEYSRFGHHPDSIQEEGEEAVDSSCSAPQEAYQRIGPGYSVVNPANEASRQTDLFDLLAETIEATISEEDSDECCDNEDTVTATSCGQVEKKAEEFQEEINSSEVNSHEMDTRESSNITNMDT